MKRAGIATAVFAFALAAALPVRAQDAAAFAGVWTLNAEKSTTAGRGGGPATAGGAPAAPRGGMAGGGMTTSMTVTAGTNELTVQRGNQTIVYKLDGSEFTIPGGRGEARATAGLVGGQIVIESSQTMAMQDNAMTTSSTETWALDGEALVITTVRSTPRGDRTTTMVYDRP
jgi:hypothetical protein